MQKEMRCATGAYGLGSARRRVRVEGEKMQKKKDTRGLFNLACGL